MGRLENSRIAVLVGTAATLFYTVLSWVPSLWFDEAATVSAVRRTPAELLDLLGNIDAVHGAYYFMMQGWTALFGVSEFALRIPSAIAGGASAGLIYAIGCRLGSSRYALVAAGIFAILPRVQYAALEARPFVFSMLFAALATWALVRIWSADEERDRTAFWWILYALCGALGVLFSLYTIFLFAAHLVTVLLVPVLRRRMLSFLASGIFWVAPAAVIGFIAYGQRDQIAWIRPLGPTTVTEYFLAQYSSRVQFLDGTDYIPTLGKIESAATSVLAVVLFTSALVGIWRVRREFLVRLALPWLLVPLAALLAGSLILGSPYYLPRYLTFTSPAIALLSAAALVPRARPTARPFARAVPIAALCALVLAAIPATISLRTTGGKDASYDYQWVAKTVAENAQPGDAIAPMGGEPNLIVRSSPDSFSGLADPTLIEPAGSIDLLFDGRVGIASAADKVQQYDRVWLIREKNDGVSPADLAALGYIPKTEYTGVTRVVTLYVRG
ncbi:glycosyltransferase family 39 protein [Haematomicrobium sanguinis]|uniref:glycosyltransferase family 39 protein n=1 Tax=Haematomicrobium sanguinis TaxID=479106 RepID=UPI000690CEC3|nr:glycosyltransferase family 39 protein [Haematomicrobium sanguinis]